MYPGYIIIGVVDRPVRANAGRNRYYGWSRRPKYHNTHVSFTEIIIIIIIIYAEIKNSSSMIRGK